MPEFNFAINHLVDQHYDVLRKFTFREIVGLTVNDLTDINRIVQARFKGEHQVLRPEVLVCNAEALVAECEPEVASRSILLRACHMMENIIHERPFADGNKRTALLALLHFINANRVRIVLPDASQDLLYLSAISMARKNGIATAARLAEALNSKTHYGAMINELMSQSKV